MSVINLSAVLASLPFSVAQSESSGPAKPSKGAEVQRVLRKPPPRPGVFDLQPPLLLRCSLYSIFRAEIELVLFGFNDAASQRYLCNAERHKASSMRPRRRSTRSIVDRVPILTQSRQPPLEGIISPQQHSSARAEADFYEPS